MATSRKTIAQLKHRVALCSMRDIVSKDGSMELSRKEVAKTWARIEPFRHQPNFMSTAGFASSTRPRSKPTP